MYTLTTKTSFTFKPPSCISNDLQRLQLISNKGSLK